MVRDDLDALLDALPRVELAALAYDWPFWAMPYQLPPPGPWRSWGSLASRRRGKTRAISEHINAEVAAGRAMWVGFCAQGENESREVQVLGESGIVATAPPWHKPTWESGRLVWPNGAQAFMFTPHEPGNMKGYALDLFWASELQDWPASKREEALKRGILPMTTRGYARLVWDATPERRHPTLRWLLERCAAEPELHHLVVGRIEDNALNLGAGAVAELRKALTGQRARQELDGIFDDDDDAALWRASWIDDHRRDLPDVLDRRVLSIDPAISDRPGTDDTGFTDQGLGVDGQVFIIANLTKKWGWDEWGAAVVARYFKHRCDCVIVERNRGGDACAANIRAAASRSGVRVEVVGPKAITRFAAGVLYVKEVNSQQSKGARAAPVATLYESGRVSHVKGGEGLDDLEDTLTTWVPEARGESPNALDAMVHGVWELAKLGEQAVDRRAGFVGIEKMAKSLGQATRGTGSAASVIASLGKTEWGSKL